MTHAEAMRRLAACPALPRGERLAWAARVYLLIGDAAVAKEKWDQMREAYSGIAPA